MMTVLAIALLLLMSIVVLLNIPSLRATLISRHLLNIFRAKLPPMSVTEQEAIAAGDTWWEKELFCGRPNWDLLHSYAKPKLSSAEHDFLTQQVPTLCAMLDDWEITQNLNDMPSEVWTYIKREKFFGMIIPQHYGGLGFSAYAHSCVITQIASRSYTAAVSVMVPNSLGPAEFLQHYGTDEQKTYYLPRLADGREMPC
nr:acyl-CoA dehydrogenase family protein [Pseudomonadota bacterium]